MTKTFAVLLALVAAFEGIASAQTSSPRIAYDACYAIAWEEFVCNIVASGSVVAASQGPDSAFAPKWSPDGSRVAFVSDGQIRVVTVADGTVVHLTNHPAFDSWPAWSRDGAKIAFAGYRDGLTELYVVNADGSNLRQLTNHIGFNGRPAWSPDSVRIAFGCEVQIGNEDICTINADASGIVRLTTDSARDYGPVFSPASGRVAFVTDRFGSDTIAVLEAGGAVRAVSGGTDPAWSPDETRIALTDGGDVLVVPVAGGAAVNLTRDTLGYYSPGWSPDGTELVFGGMATVGYSGICYFGEGAHNADDFCVPLSGVYVASADGSALNLLGAGRNPDWFVPSPGHPLASFLKQCSGSVCDFDGSGSSDPDGTILSYDWQFGDGTRGFGPTVRHAYVIGGRYVVTLTVTGASGTTAAVSMTVDANAPPAAVLAVTCSGATCTFDASGSSDPDGPIASYTWQFGDGNSGQGATVSHTYRTGTFAAVLTVADGSGATSTATRTLSVVNATPIPRFTPTCKGLTCTFDASASSDADGKIWYYSWSFGDGTTSQGTVVSHTFAAGTYTVTLTVDDLFGTATQRLSVTVAQPTMHVGDLDIVGASQQTAWTAMVTVTVHDGGHAPLAGATVSGSWSNGLAGSCTTDGLGRCTLSNAAIPKKVGSISFTAGNVTHATATYRPADNHDPDGDSTGSSVRVIKP